MPNRREVLKGITASTAITLIMPATLMLEGCTAETVLERIIRSLPVGADIALAIARYVDPNDSALFATIKAITQEIAGDLNLTSAILSDVKLDLSKNPSLVQQIDGYLNTADEYLTKLENAAHIQNADLRDKIQKGADLIRVIVDGVFSLLPTLPAPAAQVAVHANAAMVARTSAVQTSYTRFANDKHAAKHIAQSWNSIVDNQPKVKIREP